MPAVRCGEVTMQTPWGSSQSIEYRAERLAFVSTASHGGIHVPQDLVHHISAEGRAYAKRYTRSEQWYEEDCGWAYVAEAFPEVFSDDEREAAAETLRWLREDSLLKHLRNK